MMGTILSLVSEPADKIIDHLWLGSKAALDPEFLRKHRIHVIINMTTDVDTVSHVTTYRFPVRDAAVDMVRLMGLLPDILKTINKAMSQGENVLVHCRAGIQRAPTVVSRYLQDYRGLGPHTSIAMIRSRRRIAFLNGYTFKSIIFTRKQ